MDHGEHTGALTGRVLRVGTQPPAPSIRARRGRTRLLRTRAHGETADTWRLPVVRATLLRPRRALRRLRTRRVARGPRARDRAPHRVGHRAVHSSSPGRRTSSSSRCDRGRPRARHQSGPGARSHVGDQEIFTVLAALGRRELPWEGEWAEASRRASARRVPAPAAPPRPRGHDCRAHRGAGREPAPTRRPRRHPHRRRPYARFGSATRGARTRRPPRSRSSATTCPMGISQASGRWLESNSLDNTLRIVRVHPTEWILADIRVHAVADGFGHGLVHLWAEDGTLLATASQSTIVRDLRTERRAPRSRRPTDERAPALRRDRPVRRPSAARAQGVVRGTRHARVHRPLVGRGRWPRRTRAARLGGRVDAHAPPRAPRSCPSTRAVRRRSPRRPRRCARPRPDGSRSASGARRPRSCRTGTPCRTRSRTSAFATRSDSCRAALSGEKVTADYETFSVSRASASTSPVTEMPPILVGALRDGMLRLAGREGDGAITNWLSPADVPKIVEQVGADKEIVTRIMVLPTTDFDTVRASGPAHGRRVPHGPRVRRVPRVARPGRRDLREMNEKWTTRRPRRRARAGARHAASTSSSCTARPRSAAAGSRSTSTAGVTTTAPTINAQGDELRASAASARTERRRDRLRGRAGRAHGAQAARAASR